MTTSPAQRKREERARMRKRGYVLRQVWVHTQDLKQVRTFLAKINTRRNALLEK